MKKIIYILLLIVLFAAPCSLLPASDFGLLISNDIELIEDTAIYTPSFAPWFSLNNGKGFSVYLSCLISIPYNKDAYEDDWAFIPELTRFALNYRLASGMSLEAGRTGYSDAAGFVASGLFDGLRFTAPLPFGTITASAFYTGLIFKESSKIRMTDTDTLKYADPYAGGNFDLGNMESYFSSKRLFSSVRADIPFGEKFGLTAEILAQFDLNEIDENQRLEFETLNSQYGILLFNIYPIPLLNISAGGIFELMQSGDDSGFAFGVLTQVKINLPTPLNDQAGIIFKLAQGDNDKLKTFTPISSHSQGSIYPLHLSNLIVIGANYDVRLHKTVYAEALFNFFISTTDNAQGKDMTGPEIWANIGFQPFDDLRITAGGGAFFLIGGEPEWKVNLGLKLSL